MYAVLHSKIPQDCQIDSLSRLKDLCIFHFYIYLCEDVDIIYFVLPKM